ncbi:hypothetical protein [Nitrospina gracilis]|uniref:hypothetical protein n=1 Tax=Nitrospina gracilis TaxID=35801 RepID=UPI001F2C8511|nr:hypothetical protein [Nitrospina gracilis]MCF8721435.1 hypothetical protein [Nitrospina gracilis Nb-211]
MEQIEGCQQNGKDIVAWVAVPEHGNGMYGLKKKLRENTVDLFLQKTRERSNAFSKAGG